MWAGIPVRPEQGEGPAALLEIAEASEWGCIHSCAVLEVTSAAVLEKPCLRRCGLQGSRQQHNEQDPHWKHRKNTVLLAEGKFNGKAPFRRFKSAAVEGRR